MEDGSRKMAWKGNGKFTHVWLSQGYYDWLPRRRPRTTEQARASAWAKSVRGHPWDGKMDAGRNGQSRNKILRAICLPSRPAYEPRSSVRAHTFLSRGNRTLENAWLPWAILCRGSDRRALCLVDAERRIYTALSWARAARQAGSFRGAGSPSLRSEKTT